MAQSHRKSNTRPTSCQNIYELKFTKQQRETNKSSSYYDAALHKHWIVPMQDQQGMELQENYFMMNVVFHKTVVH